MTPLPTREDGGIDWQAFTFPEAMVYWSDTECKPHEMDILFFYEQVAAHERERCVKWHDGREAFYLSIQSLYQARVHRESAAALRKLKE